MCRLASGARPSRSRSLALARQSPSSATAVGLLAVLAARQLGAERIIAMSLHEDRQRLAREFGATEIVEERGDDGVERIKELTDGLGGHSVVEAVGTQESMMQALHATLWGAKIRCAPREISDLQAGH
jgi:threonine dehydrogenase-like Zn-dependent dehydrogenase